MGRPRGFGLVLVAALLMLDRGCVAPKLAEDHGWLADGERLALSLAPGRSHRFRIRLARGQSLALSLEQQEQDLTLTLLPPTGPPVLIDGFTEATGPERVFAVAERAGDYGLVVELGDGAVGSYGLSCVIKQAGPREQAAAASQTAGLAGVGANPAQAIEAFNQAIAYARIAGDPLLEGDWVTRRAWAEGKLAQSERNRSSLAEAARLFTAAGCPSRAAVVWRDLAFSTCESDPALARQLFSAALEDASACASPSLLARLQQNFADQLLRWGDFSEAISHLEQARLVLGDTWPRLRAQALGELAHAYGSCGRVALARSLLEEAIALLPSEGDRELRTRLGVELAWSWYLEQRYERAIAALMELQRQWPQMGDEVDAGIQDRLGSALRESGRYTEAIPHYQRALRTSRPGSDNQAHVRANLASLYLAQGNYRQAIAQAQQARQIFGAARQLLPNAHALKIEARAWAKLGQSARALEAVAEAVRLLEQIRDQITTPTQGLSLTAAQFEAYQDYLDLMLENDRQKYAVQAFELLEWLRSRRERQRLAAVDQILRDRSHRDQALDRIQRDMALAEADGRLHGEGETERLLERVEYESERLRGPGKEMAPAVDLPTVQATLLGENDLLLSYCLGPARSYLFVLDRLQLTIFDLPPESEIDFQVENYLSRLSRQSQSATPLTTSWGRTVTQTLMGDLKQRAKGKRLLIIKDGVLHDLPFAALPDPAEPSKPLVAGHELAVLPSATQAVLASWMRYSQTKGTGALVLADPVYETTDPRRTGQVAVQAQAPIERLPETGREAAALLGLRPRSRALLGLAATKTALLGEDLSRYEIVHFGVHGQLHQAHPNFSRLLLSRFDAAGKSCDGALRAQELALLTMPVELATLSGCRTAQGRTYRGDGLWSLGRDFMNAGAARVLVSLWDVDDHATAELMIAFYQKLLGEGQRPSAALRSAQLALMARKELSSPYLWAAFELQGDPGPWGGQKRASPGSVEPRP